MSGDVSSVVGGERRQLTVMFCDLVGSTALSEQLDPEDLGDLVLGYQEMGRSAVERFGGSVAQYLGDGLLTYFGYPVAHEDDATRAVFAALTILESLDGLSDRVGVSGAGLAARVGIHTGSAVIGEMGSGDRSDTSVFGSTPNIAARLEAMAAQGTVLISDSTRRQLRSRFVLADLGTPELKGIDRPIHVWRVVGIDETAALRCPTPDPVPLIGRIHQLSSIRGFVDSSFRGESKVMLIRGEPGVGKSRLGQGMFHELRGASQRLAVHRSQVPA